MSAVAALGEEEAGRAAQYLFGLVHGTAGRRPTDLREAAAREFGGLSPETFRKRQEPLLLGRIADEILLPLQTPTRHPAGRPFSAHPPGVHRDLAELEWDIARAVEVTPVRRYGPYQVSIAARQDTQGHQTPIFSRNGPPTGDRKLQE